MPLQQAEDKGHQYLKEAVEQAIMPQFNAWGKYGTLTVQVPSGTDSRHLPYLPGYSVTLNGTTVTIRGSRDRD